MRTFNIISAAIFGLFTIACLWAAFYNPVHIFLAGAAGMLTAAALSDDSDGESIIDSLTRKH